MNYFYKTIAYSRAFALMWETDETEICFLVVYQVMDVEHLDDRDEHELSVTVFVQDEAYCPKPVYSFCTNATVEELIEEDDFQLNIMNMLRDDKEFRGICCDCYKTCIQGMSEWSHCD